MPPFLEVHKLHKSFGSNHVLKGVHLEIQKGDSLVILGGSGSGKSVLMKHMIGLMHPDQGHIALEGVRLEDLDLNEMYRIRRRYGMSFQEAALFDSMTVGQNVAFPLKRQRRDWKPAQVQARVTECLEMVGMPGVAQRMPNELSGGMRRRVGFARAIALQPEILLFDEPTTGLDPVMTSVLNEIIVTLRQRLNATTITITHDLSSARAIATRVAMLYRGQIILATDRDSFFASTDPLVQQFLQGKAEGPMTEALMR